ncbi:hypothetical protein CTA1_1225 [Colletotrichum tanaceti]|uniref:Uncharacterized protein n=1 Tax=Colletotrichum tanaceti TaxID=1306861 RepID=A0A4U6X1A4_9PEZI|nr:hypothetical protein CTA1_1225 [Colletotrichum tanaceti]
MTDHPAILVTNQPPLSPPLLPPISPPFPPTQMQLSASLGISNPKPTHTEMSENEASHVITAAWLRCSGPRWRRVCCDHVCNSYERVNVTNRTRLAAKRGSG